MRTFQHIAALRTYLRVMRDEGKTVGLVPTMGALHEGHLSLFNRAKMDCDLAVATIFVNPTQFGRNEDFDAYPRDLNHDLQLASNAGVVAVFHPSVDELYPAGFQTTIVLPQISSMLEGAYRPGHFEGVATIVNKLFNIVQPDRAYFGMKDYQQLTLIERMVYDLNLHLDVVAVPTMRDENGLALSSRNKYLSPEEKKAAFVLNRTLKKAEAAMLDGETDSATLLASLNEEIDSEPLAKIDYLELVNPETLLPVSTLSNATTLVVMAVRIGKTRLIDNQLVAPAGIKPVRFKKRETIC